MFIPLLLAAACASRRKPPALSLEAVQAERHFEYGMSKLRQGKPGKAEKEFRRALKLDPGRAVFYQGLGAALHEQGKPRLAARVLLEGAALDSSLPNLFFQLGDVYTDCKCWAGVVKYSLFALEFEHFKFRAAALANLGLAYMEMEFWEPARYTLEAALMEDAQCVPALWRLMLTLAQLQEWPQTIRYGRRILRLAREHPHWLSDFFLSQVNEQIALAYAKLGKPLAGRPFRQEARRLAPGRNITLEK